MARTITVEGIDSTTLALSRTGDRISKHSLDVVEKYAEYMIKSAKDYAPIKDGYLENSIGRFENEKVDGSRRMSVLWGVDTDKLGPGYTVKGHRYDITMENGEYKLGKRSSDKQDDLGVDVGPGFLTRALWDWQDDLIKELERLVKRG